VQTTTTTTDQSLTPQQTQQAPRLEASWLQRLNDEFEKPYMKNLRNFLLEQKKAKKVIYPPGPEIFAALDQTPFDRLKVVILGQDPYHGPGQAHGLSFSVKAGTPPPPSLVNIFKELHDDTKLEVPATGDLTAWAKQGVLLLNAALTVEQGRPLSHQGQGWEQFTDKIIHVINEEKTGVVFILWGAFAQRKAQFVDRKKHFVIESPHPSPLSSYRGFFGSKPFSRTNEYLTSIGKDPIDWNL
jgi:uracil-DNA glycosylase